MEEREPIIIPTIWAEDGENSFASAYHANDSTFATGEVVSADRSSESTQLEQRRPEEEGSAEETTSGPKTLADLHDEIRVQGQTEHEAKQSHRENLEFLAQELGVDGEDLHVPSKVAAYSAETILKVMGEYGFEVSDFSSPAKMTSMLAALEQEAQDAEEKELAAVRESLESESENDPDAEELDEDDESEEVEEPEEESESQEEPQEEQKPAEGERPTSLADLTPEQRVQMQHHIEEVYQRSQQFNDPVYTELFATGLMQALNIPAEHASEFKAAAEVLQFGAQNLLETLLPAAVDHYMRANFHDAMESYAPGFSDRYTQQTLNDTWESVRGDLPKFNSPEFNELAKSIHEQHPWLNAVEFNDAEGKPLPMMQALHAKAELTAKLCRGERVTPKHFQQAIAQAKEDVSRSKRRVSAGRSLGAGKTTGKIAPKEEQFTSLMDAYKAGGSGGSFDK